MENQNLVPSHAPSGLAESIAVPIHLIRGRKVMLSRDLAKLYGVPTQNIHDVIKRHRKKFPEGVAFRLTRREFDALKSQGVMQNGSRNGGSSHRPWVLTENGVALISILMPGKRDVRVNRITGWDRVGT
jgi:hypothetical protein